MNCLVTGGTGLLGSEFKKLLGDGLIIGSKDADLTNKEQVNVLFKSARSQGIDRVIHCAAKVGGLQANMKNPVAFFEKNVLMNTNIVQACHENKMSLTAVLSSCIYPDEKFASYPLTEDQLHNGPPHISNFAYAYSKRMLEVQCSAYRNQFGSNFITVIPNNLYGTNDNYSLDESHVIPALIRKFYEAKIKNQDEVILWGSGTPVREFTFSKDAAKIILWISKNYNGDKPVNIGNTSQISIKDLAEKIKNIVDFKGRLIFDSNMPDGQFEKPTSNKFLNEIGCNITYTSLDDGLKETIDFFEKNYHSLRGIENVSPDRKSI